MHKKIKDIYNAIWQSYKVFLSDRSVSEYTHRVAEIGKRYADDPLMQGLATNLAISMMPVINTLAEQYRIEREKEQIAGFGEEEQ